MPKTLLLGPQGTTPTIGTVLAEHGVRGRVALVRAGYRERETEDAETIAALGVPAVNLRLYERSIAVFRADEEFAKAYSARQRELRNMQSFYRIRLDKTDEAARTISVRHVAPELLAQERSVSVDEFRNLDANHASRREALHNAFEAKWRPSEREPVARNREELRAELETCDALVIAGGHVATLRNRLALFDVLGLAPMPLVFAWSGGAMVLTDRIVLFHDYPPYGTDIARVLDAGFGLAPGIVVLPDPRRRINFDARRRIERFARRMAPATCVAMDHGAQIVFDDSGLVAGKGTRLTETGAVDHDWDGSLPRSQSPQLVLGSP